MKKILALILALLMMMTVFVGCGSDVEAELDSQDDVAVDEEISDDADEESEKEAYVRIDALCDNEYNFYEFTMKNEGIKEISSGIDVSDCYIEGETVAELLERTGYTELDFSKEYEGFLGFSLYNMNEDTLEKTDDEKLYSLEEMLEYVVPEQSICFVARWENTSDEIYESMGY